MQKSLSSAINASQQPRMGVRKVKRVGGIRYGHALIAPMMLGFLFFSLLPMAVVFVLSFFNWNLVGIPTYAGLQNYLSALGSSAFWHSLGLTFLYVVYNVPVQGLVALGLALILNQSLPGFGVFRTVFLIPWVTAPIAVATVWSWILNPLTGILNFVLGVLNLPLIDWFSTTEALRSVALVNIWQFTGYETLLFLVGLQSIPIMYYEAAAIEGAKAWQHFRYVTLPLLKPTMLFIVITSTLGAVQVFDTVFGMTKGGPANSTRVINYYIYQEGFSYLRMGYAAALCVILFVLLLSFTVVQFRIFQES